GLFLLGKPVVVSREPAVRWAWSTRRIPRWRQTAKRHGELGWTNGKVAATSVRHPRGGGADRASATHGRWSPVERWRVRNRVMSVNGLAFGYGSNSIPTRLRGEPRTPADASW